VCVLRPQKAPYVPYTYIAILYEVYTGISTQVNGMAVDWLSGSVYWSDALYNWITVARLVSWNVFNHIVTTELDRPMGIAVHPQNGYEYIVLILVVISFESLTLIVVIIMLLISIGGCIIK